MSGFIVREQGEVAFVIRGALLCAARRAPSEVRQRLTVKER